MSDQQKADMGIRETINKRQRTAMGVTTVIIVLAISWAVMSQRSPVGRVGQAYYADESGNGFFADDVDRVYPFDHNGKPAYRAYVYQCTDGKKFVSYIARYNEATRLKLEELSKKQGDPAAAGEITQVRGSGIEVKKPGDGKWVPLYSREGDAIASHPACPDGSTARNVVP